MATEGIKFEPPAQSRDEDILYTTLQRQPYEKEPESRIEDLLIQLNESIISGGGGFTPTETQLAAMNSGIDSEKVQQIETNKTNISLKQDIIDSSHKLNADLVDDSNSTNKFATAAQLSQIATNTSNIARKIGASDYATQTTGGTVRVWTTTDGTSTTLHVSTEAPSP